MRVHSNGSEADNSDSGTGLNNNGLVNSLTHFFIELSGFNN